MHKALQLTRDAFSGILDLIYPPLCLACGQADDNYFCAACIESIDIIGREHCSKCGMPKDKPHCFDCEDRQFAFDQACSAGVFEGALRKAIHALKYDSRIVIADPLAEIMARGFPDTFFTGKVDIIIPIPIHRSRLLERGFNQAEELASRLGRRIHLPLATDVIYRKHRTRHQVDLSRDLRVTNLEKAFAVKNPGKISGKRVLLIDDVFTTGSTLHEAALALKDAGAREVRCYTLARSI